MLMLVLDTFLEGLKRSSRTNYIEFLKTHRDNLSVREWVLERDPKTWWELGLSVPIGTKIYISSCSHHSGGIEGYLLKTGDNRFIVFSEYSSSEEEEDEIPFQDTSHKEVYGVLYLTPSKAEKFNFSAKHQGLRNPEDFTWMEPSEEELRIIQGVDPEYVWEGFELPSNSNIYGKFSLERDRLKEELEKNMSEEDKLRLRALLQAQYDLGIETGP